jgi:hypothetical protein
MTSLILDISQTKDKKLFIDLAKRLNVKHHEKPYRFLPDIIRYQNKVFILNQALECKIEVVDENYTITNQILDITTWGESLEEAQDAFSFSFYALYENFYNENSEKLSSKAIKVKEKLHNLIKLVVE